jgi:Putative addiction module component
MKTKELLKEIASLPVEDRALVAESVLRSLNPIESDIEKKWGEVAERRLAELRSGEVKTVPGREVFGAIWKKYSR